MFEELLRELHGEEALPYDILVERSEGYSGSDIRLLCKEAAMQPLRRLMAVLEDRQEAMLEDGMCFLYFTKSFHKLDKEFCKFIFLP